MPVGARRPSRLSVIGRSSSWVIACLLVAAVAVPPAEAQTLRQPPPSRPGESAPLYDLQRDEALGGHTLARHVGRTDEQLAERLRREPQISAASTYTNVVTARETVTAAIRQSRVRISAWEARRGNRPNLVLNYVARTDRIGFSGPMGRSLRRGARVSEPCDRALVVLRWLERERRWIVLTSYPETRR